MSNIRPDNSSGLIWVQTVCQGYQQTTLVDKELNWSVKLQKPESLTMLNISQDTAHLSLVVRKLAFCICKNKDADQLRGKREADRRHCFFYTDSTIPLLPKSEILSF